MSADAESSTADTPADTPADTRTPAPRRRRRRLPFWLEVPLLLALALALAVVVQGFVVRMFVVPSGSMETTLHGCPGCSNDRIAVDRLGYRFGPPAPGQVVVFRAPPAWEDNDEVAAPPPSQPLLNRLSAWASLSSPDEKDFVKRVVAVGGQTVACCDRGRVTVDGRALDEPYVHLEAGSPAEQAAFAPVRLAPGQLWVMGDNRNNSADSRVHGPIGTDDVVGRARAIVLPVDRWGTIPAPDPQQR